MFRINSVLMLWAAVLLSAGSSGAQTFDPVGTWQGVLTQPGSPINEENYVFWLEIERDGDRLVGRTRIEVPRTNFYGIMTVTADRDGYKLSLTETGIEHENNKPGTIWCVKTATLTYSPRDKTLKGKWKADNCTVFGEIILNRSEVEATERDRPKEETVSIDDLKAAVKNNESIVNKRVVLDDIYFNPGQSTLTSASRDQLQALVGLMQDVPTLTIRISGHTDSRGSDALCLKLSLDRAKAVRQYLKQHGIKEARIACLGFGKARPVGDNNTTEGRKKNRRVEFVIVSQ